MPHGVDERGPVPVHPDQLELPFPKVPERGVSFLRHGARRFAEKRGRTYSAQGLDQVQAQPQFQTRVGKLYESLPVYHGDKRIARSYEALKTEVHEQYEYLTTPRHKGGLGVVHEITDEDPYKSREEMQQDVHVNRRLRTLASAQTGGAPHQFLDEETNDKFRAVHDAFGHSATGRSFSRHGEEAAYMSHAQMFSGEARPALMTETRAQNSALNFARTEGFPEQKPVLLPHWMTTKVHPAVSPRQMKK